MSEYTISKVYANDRRALARIDDLLEEEGITRDANLDYTCAMYDEDYNVIGTGSCFGNTLRCFAVSHAHQGEGLLNQIITHLIDVQYERGNLHLFLYTKVSSALFFGDLGFYEIGRVDGTLVFMENRRDGFSRYLDGLKRDLPAGTGDFSAKEGNLPAGAGNLSAKEGNLPAGAGSSSAKEGDLPAGAGNFPDRTGGTMTPGAEAAIVMNANPFTLGHRYLVETAAAACQRLHLFVVSEDMSLVPASVRKKLVREGTAHLSNVVIHDSGPYMISNATFPSYFLKDEAAVITGHAKLDIEIFTRIAKALGITVRYVGEEPSSEVTGIYNQIMAEDLPKAGIECRIIPRKTVPQTDHAGESPMPISASTVRQCLQRGDWETLRTLVPETTLRYFRSPEAEPVLKKIRSAGNVVHY